MTMNDDDQMIEQLAEPSRIIEGYLCTCETDMPDSFDHDPLCDLQNSQDFKAGWAEWDDEAFVLLDTFLDLDGIRWDDDDLVTTDKVVHDASVFPPMNPPANWWKDLGKKTSTYTPAPKCRHYQESHELPDGTVVYASSHHRDRENDPIPDLGIYMDGCWTPDTVAFHVGCPDYGTPTPSVAAVLHIAREGIRIARKGGRVELGCIGGHGRTGLMLGIMTVLTMEVPNGKEAVDRVRKNYCNRAIESEEQEWYIAGIAAEITGNVWPDPPPPPKKWTTLTTDKKDYKKDTKK